MGKIKVIYILGPGKNGSTLLERIIGTIPSFFPIGEVPNMWREGLIRNTLCSCGVPFNSCKFWKEINKDMIKKISGFNPRKVERLRRLIQKVYYAPFLIMPSLATEKYNRNLVRYKKILLELYGAMSSAIGNSVIVDSSKDPVHCLILAQMPEIELYVIDLLRDSRAVAFSWQRKSPKPDVYWKEDFMAIHRVTTTSRRWLQSRLGAGIIRTRCKAFCLLKYEELIANPKKEVLRVMNRFGFEIRGRDLGFLDDRAIRFKRFHTISGNPVRFTKGKINLVEDEQWKTKMSLGKKITVTALTYLLLKRYRYI